MILTCDIFNSSNSFCIIIYRQILALSSNTELTVLEKSLPKFSLVTHLLCTVIENKC